jgi:hypothetical protein
MINTDNTEREDKTGVSTMARLRSVEDIVGACSCEVGDTS